MNEITLGEAIKPPTGAPITQAQLTQFQEEGYCVLPAIVPESLMNLLSEECGQAIVNVHAEMETKGVDVLGGSRMRVAVHARWMPERAATAPRVPVQ